MEQCFGETDLAQLLQLPIFRSLELSTDTLPTNLIDTRSFKNKSTSKRTKPIAPVIRDDSIPVNTERSGQYGDQDVIAEDTIGIWTQDVVETSVNGLSSSVKHITPYQGQSSWDNSSESALRTLPPQRLQNELVAMYFRHVHPLCPIVDEYRFCKVYFQQNRDQFLGEFPAILFQAMLFAALGHIDPSQLSAMGHLNVFEAQNERYDICKRLYVIARTRVSSSLDEITLAKTALLLTFQTPASMSDDEAELNHQWADRAIYHLKGAMWHVPLKHQLDINRLKICYWSCICRNTILSCGLRRPYRLHIQTTYLFEPEELLSSFEFEKSQPRFFDKETKTLHIETFIWFCKLCRILNTAIGFQREHSLYSLLTLKTAHTFYQNEKLWMQQIDEEKLQLINLEKSEFRILEISQEYEKKINVRSKKRKFSDDLNGASNMMPVYMLRMITNSSIATLYESYLHATPTRGSPENRRKALQKLLDSTAKVTSIVDQLLEHVELEAIPVGILAWIIVPTAIIFVSHSWPHITAANPLASKTVSLKKHAAEQQRSKMLRLTRLLVPRSNGAQLVWRILEQMKAAAKATTSATRLGKAGINDDNSIDQSDDEQYIEALIRTISSFTST